MNKREWVEAYLDVEKALEECEIEGPEGWSVRVIPDFLGGIGILGLNRGAPDLAMRTTVLLNKEIPVEQGDVLRFKIQQAMLSMCDLIGRQERGE